MTNGEIARILREIAILLDGVKAIGGDPWYKHANCKRSFNNIWPWSMCKNKKLQVITLLYLSDTL